MMLDALSFLPIILFLVFEGLFSGGEIALVASDTHKIRQRAKAGSRSDIIALKLLEKPEWFLSTTLTGTNLCEVSNTAFITALFISHYGMEKGEFLSILIMIPLILIIGEMVPKSVFQHHADFIAPKIAWFIWTASWIFYPIVFVLSKISRGAVHTLTKRKEAAYSPYITKEGLEFLLKDEGGKGDIMKSEKDMIQRIFDFSDAMAGQIMIPLSNVTALPSDITLKEAAGITAEKGYSRIPIYSDQVFNITGILHSFELLEFFYERDSDAAAFTGDEPVERFIKKDIPYIPESKLASELFLELQRRAEHMAIVVDEYGGAIGIVTIEDILEEIVGEIDDEYQDKGKFLYRKVGPGKYLFNAKTNMDRIRELIPLDIPQGDYETLGGFLLNRMGAIPKRSETVREGEILFVIEDSDMKSIREVLIILPPGINLAR
jgi:putative hemolysin